MPFENAQKISEKTRRLANLAEDFPIDDAPFKQRLHLLFSQIEKEFELVFLENLSRKWNIILAQKKKKYANTEHTVY